jgi:cytochrome c5
MMKTGTHLKHLATVTIACTWLMAAIAPSYAADGEAIYNSSCRMCHGTGMMNAPQLGNTEAWEARIAKGREKLYENSIKGFRDQATMPARGGNSSLTDAEVKAAVDYLVEQSQK